MADTQVYAFVSDANIGRELRITDEGGTTVLNNSPGGDVLTSDVSGRCETIISEALAGEYEAGIFDGSTCWGRFKLVLADDDGPYYCEEPSTAASQASVDDVPTVAEFEARTLASAGYGTAANQITILARLGAFAGSGLNTVFGFLRALAAKAAGLTPSELSTGTTFSNTTHSQEALADAIGDIEGGGGGGGDCPTLNEIVAALSDREVTIHSPVAEDGTITLWQGDGYSDEALQITVQEFSEEDPATYQALTFGLMLTSDYEAGTGTSSLEVSATGELTSNVATFTIELTNDETDALSPSPADDRYNYTYQLVATLHNGDHRTIASGAATVKRKVVQ